MSKQNVISARVGDEVLAMVDRLAAGQERSRAWIVSNAIERWVRKEIEFLDFIKEGEDAIARGEYVTHDELISELRAMADKKRAA